MKNYLLPLLVLIGLATSAQNYKSQLWISLGGNRPLGDFGSTTSVQSGYATAGANVRLNYQYNFTKNIGFVLLLHGTSNGFNNVAQQEQLGNESPGTIWSVESDGWGVSGLLFGPVFTWPVTNRIHIDGTVAFGVNAVTSPQITAHELTIPVSITQGSGNASAFVYTFGFGAKFFLRNPHWFIPIHFDFLICGANFENMETRTTTPKGLRITNKNYSQQMNTYNSSIGFGYAF